MLSDPKTRRSLIVRLGDPADDAAWSEFLDIYEPMLFRLASRWGLQLSDAAEVVQETLLAVAQSISGYRPAEHPGAFRGWLAAITRNKLADHLTARSRGQQGSGDSDVHRWLDEQADPVTAESRWDWHEKRQIFAWAQQRVRGQVAARTWQAFYRTAVLNDPVAEVARQLDQPVGMIYVARSRVMARLREAVDHWTVIGSKSQGELP